MDSLPKSSEEFFQFFRAEIAAQPVLSSSDLGRVGIERHKGQTTIVREMPSVGALRLSGEAVSGHDASLESVSLLGLAFQRLVTVVGAALEGFTNVRGRIPTEFLARTALNLKAAPKPGSLILDIAPTMGPDEELRGNGALFNDTDVQLLDASIERLGSLFDAAMHHEPGQDDSAFSSELRQLGPRAAGALKSFAQVTSKADIDFGLTWTVPLRPKTSITLTNRDAVWMAHVIAGRQLDAQNVKVHGTLLTVSHGKKWELHESEFGDVSIDVSAIDGRPWVEWNPDDLVEVDAEVTITEAPGRAASRSFTALSIRPWEGSLEDIDQPSESEFPL